MAGLRERKKAATRLAIHEAGMRLFDEHGFGGTTVDDIADAAGVSRATVFTYFPTKEEIVFGDTASAIEGLAARLQAGDEPAIPTVRAWLTELTGWLEPELLLQRRLRQEAPTVAAHFQQVISALTDVIAAALETELGAEEHLVARLTAGSLTAGLQAVEASAAAQMSHRGHALAPVEIDQILDATVAYVQAGMAAVAGDALRADAAHGPGAGA
jgi:AcrR family transcriptional regulator